MRTRPLKLRRALAASPLLCAALLAAIACREDPAAPIPVASVTVIVPKSRLAPGETMQLAAVTLDQNGAALGGRRVEWSSGSNAVATVSAGGLVTAAGEGSARITATSEGIQGHVDLTVVYPFPDVAGEYAVTGSFDGINSPFEGTMLLLQPTRTSGAFSGSMAVTVHDAIDGDIQFSGLVTLASLTEGGAVSFYFGSPTAGTTWRFTGQVSGATMTGRHVLANPLIATYSGPWTATRRAAAVAGGTALSSGERRFGDLLERLRGSR